MASTTRNILAAIQSRLAAVDGTGAYNNDLSQDAGQVAYRRRDQRTDPWQSGLPHVGWWVDDIDEIDGPLSHETMEIEVHVRGYVAPGSAADSAWAYEAADLASDIQRAILGYGASSTSSDRSLGVNGVRGIRLEGLTFDQVQTNGATWAVVDGSVVVSFYTRGGL